MCLLSVGLETLGLLLRVWLWISVPIAVIFLLVATWLHYLRGLRSKSNLRLAVEGFGGEVRPVNVELEGGGGGGGDERDREELDREEFDREELTATGKETIYQGILWMKEKYEHYREQADHRYELLREELGRSERRYRELQTTMQQDKDHALEAHLVKTGEQHADWQGQLDAKQRIIEDLEAQLRSERLRVGELVQKLQANSELILRIYRELEGIPDLGK
jgi:hypothetical protein